MSDVECGIYSAPLLIVAHSTLSERMLRDSTRSLEPPSAVNSCRVARPLLSGSENMLAVKYAYGASQQHDCLNIIVWC